MIIVTGAAGQLGSDLVKELARRGLPHKGIDLRDADITCKDEAAAALQNASAVIHCAAYTEVEKAEDEPDLCRRINTEGTRNIALACKATGARLLYISTDYVIAPNVYGESKLAGERAVQELLSNYFIVRSSWLFGKNGRNFVSTMLRLGKEQPEVNVVNDQIGSPTYTIDLAPLLCDMILTEKYGMYNATNEGYCSWADFAKEIFAQARLETRVNPIPTSQYPIKAVRPLDSRLDKAALDEAGFRRLPPWQDALSRYLMEIGIADA